MNWIWVIVLLGFAFIPSLATLRKRSQAAATYVDDSDSEETEDSFFNFDAVEAEEAVPAQNPYFTYEAPQAEVEHVAPVATVAAPEEFTRPAFDLRSAIIYQTVLTNKYNS